jgi:hypothetical protein
MVYYERDRLYNTIADLERVGVGNYAEDVLDLLWESGSKYTADGLEQAYKEP